MTRRRSRGGAPARRLRWHDRRSGHGARPQSSSPASDRPPLCMLARCCDLKFHIATTADASDRHPRADRRRRRRHLHRRDPARQPTAGPALASSSRRLPTTTEPSSRRSQGARERAHRHRRRRPRDDRRDQRRARAPRRLDGARDDGRVPRRARAAPACASRTCTTPSGASPSPLVPRRRRFELRERVGADGTVLEPLDPAEARAVAARLRADGVESVAVCLLHSYALPGARAAARARSCARSSPTSRSRSRARSCASSGSTSARRRPSSTPTCGRSWAATSQTSAAGLDGAGIDAPLTIMQSSGGVMSAEDAARRPVLALESGPAAGVVAALGIARRLGLRKRDRLRHGRDDGEGVADRGRRRLSRARVRGRRHRSRPAAGCMRGTRRAAAHPDDRHRRGRRRRRLDRLARPGRRAAGRPAERRCGAGARLLRARRERADGHRRERRARLHARRAARRRGDLDLAGARRGGARAGRRAARALEPRGGAGIHAIANARDDAGAARRLLGEGPRPARVRADRLRRLRAGSRARTRRRARLPNRRSSRALAGLFSSVGLLFARPEFHDVRICHLDARTLEPRQVDGALHGSGRKRFALEGLELGALADLRYDGQSWRSRSSCRRAPIDPEGLVARLRGRARAPLRRARRARLADRHPGAAPDRLGRLERRRGVRGRAGAAAARGAARRAASDETPERGAGAHARPRSAPGPSRARCSSTSTTRRSSCRPAGRRGSTRRPTPSILERAR